MSKPQSAWLILIEENRAVVGLLTETGDVLVAQERDWDGSNQEDLLAAIDTGRGDCLSSSGEKEGPSGVIFILPSSWVDPQGEILSSYKEKLKFVSQHLSLTPLGFLVKDEVLSRWGKKEGEFSQSDFFHYLAQLVSDQEGEKEEGQVEEEEKEEELSFGFREGDVAETMGVVETEESEEQSTIESATTIKEEPAPSEKLQEEVTKEEEIGEKKDRRFFLRSLALYLKDKLVSFSLPKIPINRRGVFLFLPLILLFLCFLTWFFSKATVEIYLTPEEITTEIKAKLDPEAKMIDIENGIIPAEPVEVILEGEKTTATTGEKLVGEKAKGEVTIYNRTSETQLFEAGTILEGPGGLKFVLDNDVKVASKTPDLVSGVDRWGEAKVTVTAAEIGAEYNLAAESVFTVSGFSKDEFLAKNQEAFTGGTSRKVRAVSKEDQESLKKLLIEELSSLAKERLKSRATDGKILFESLRIEVIDQDYSAAVGDEKDELTLNLKVKAIAAKLSQSRLDELAQQVLSQKVKEQSVLEPTTVTTELKSVEVDEDGVVSGDLVLTGKAYPKIDQRELAQRLAKKRIKEAGKIIRSYPRIYRYQINFHPSIIKFFSFLPPKAENINIEMKE